MMHLLFARTLILRRHLAVGLAALAILAAPATSRGEIQPGRVYRGGEVISDEASGLRLTLPEGWHGQLSADGESFRLVPDEGEAYLVVIADELTDADARAQMARPIDLGDGIQLHPTGEIVEVASRHLSANFTVKGPPSTFDGTIDVRLTDSGLGVVFILLSPPALTETARETMREFAFSLGVSEPRRNEAAQSDTSSGGDRWQPYLRGKYLARYYTATGYTESTEIWLCSDGSFRYRSNGGGFGGGASGAYQGTGGGRWAATGAGATGQLILQWSSGERTTLDLTYDYEQNRLYVNGKRYLRGKNEICR